MEVAVPDKHFFKIGEIAAFTSLRPSVLRYWESEFAVLSPVKSRSGQRLYSRKDLELILEIKHLLYSEKLTIEGARKRICSRKKQASAPDYDDRLAALVIDVRNEIVKLRDFLSERDSGA